MNRARAAAEKNINNVMAADIKRSQERGIMKKLFFTAACISALLLGSCDLLELFKTIDSSSSTGNFWAVNFTNGRDYRVDAELLAEGIHCNVWVEKSSGKNTDDAEAVADHFDNHIYDIMIDNFSIKNFNYRNNNFDNIVQFAGWLSGGDGKLCILLLDIKDGFKRDPDPYVAGYFWNGDIYKNDNNAVQGSNERIIIYIDTYPGMSNDKTAEAYSTLAHEMQHLMNFATGVVKRPRTLAGLTYAYTMDTWVDEGLSAAAEYVYSGEHSQERINWFKTNGNGNGRITSGNNFFVWNNYINNSHAILDDYSTVYLFFQWLRLQAGSSDIYKKIISSTKSNHEAVVDAMKEYNSYATWDFLLESWLTANHLNMPDGPFGYMEDSDLIKIKIPSSSISAKVSLAPGEGVYSRVYSKPNLSGQGLNIRNFYIENDGPTDQFSSGSVLLTYNLNANYNFNENNQNFSSGGPETGVTSGHPIHNTNIVSAERSVKPVFSGPYRIGAGDLLRERSFIIDNEQ